MPDHDLQLRILNLFFGIIILILPILPFIVALNTITVILAVFAFGLFNIGASNMVIGISEITRDEWVKYAEIIIGIVASSIAFCLFFIIFLTSANELTPLAVVFVIIFLIVTFSTNMAGIFESNTKRVAKMIFIAVGLSSLIILVIFLTSLFFGVNIYLIAFSLALIIYGSSRILLGITGIS